jgi:hypothetical protein
MFAKHLVALSMCVLNSTLIGQNTFTTKGTKATKNSNERSVGPSRAKFHPQWNYRSDQQNPFWSSLFVLFVNFVVKIFVSSG